MGNEAPKLIVCGTGPMEQWCRVFIKENRCNIEMKGFISNGETRLLIAKSKALVLPTQWYEGFPMSIVEAFSVGTPVICSNIGNVASVVHNGLSGIKFSYQSVPELCCAIRERYLLPSLPETTFDEYNKLYTEDKNYNMLVEIYKNAIRTGSK
jgi:glycosyltransferase involved in cell wall biosynthesis